MTKKGWICPVCGRGMSPTKESCDCVKSQQLTHVNHQYAWYCNLCWTMVFSPGHICRSPHYYRVGTPYYGTANVHGANTVLYSGTSTVTMTSNLKPDDEDPPALFAV